jgi:hypothetical protein
MQALALRLGALMKVEIFPLLEKQRELYRIPRGVERFHSYLREMIDPESRDLRLPLVAMNPMGKDHIPALLDQLIALDAENAAAQAIAEAAPRLKGIPGDYRLALVLSDDAMGGWTNRYTSEYSHRFESGTLLRRGWLVGVLWTSEPPALETVREAALTAVYRAAYIQQHGFAENLRERMAQEGYSMAMAGCRSLRLNPEEIAATREIIQPFLETRDMRTGVECLFGDEAAISLGFTPRGLQDRAGFALALQDARKAAKI